jgi:diadenosine tetraphosphatase ApaH/serine/threonine PP2A family protein phosphatase
VPEVREVGVRLIVNDGSAGYAFDGDPRASWAMIDVVGAEVFPEIKRVEYDVLAAADAVAERGLPGDVYRAATIRNGRMVR